MCLFHKKICTRKETEILRRLGVKGAPPAGLPSGLYYKCIGLVDRVLCKPANAILYGQGRSILHFKQASVNGSSKAPVLCKALHELEV